MTPPLLQQSRPTEQWELTVALDGSCAKVRDSERCLAQIRSVMRRFGSEGGAG